MRCVVGFRFVIVAVGVTLVCFSLPSGAQAPGATERVSVSSTGTQGNADSRDPVLSGDGRYVAFESKATTLGSVSAASDVFVHDRQTGATSLVSVASDGVEVSGEGNSFSAAISVDGRYVAFVSTSSNLVADDMNGAFDIFVRDREMGTTTRASVNSEGTQGNGDSVERPSISGDGRYAAFESLASNLVPDDTNGAWDVFVREITDEEPTPQADISLDGSPFGAGDRLTATFQLNESITQPFTVFAVLILPDGVTMLNALTLDTPLAPVATNVPGLTVTDGPFTFPLINTVIPPGAPSGDYEIVVAFFTPGVPITGREDAFLEASVPFTIE